MRRRRVKNALHDQQLLIERDHLAYALEWWTAKQAQPPTDEELMRAAHQYLTERVQGDAQLSPQQRVMVLGELLKDLREKGLP